MARALLGDVYELAAMADAPRRDGEDLAVVLMRFASGALGVIEANYHCPLGAFDDAIEVCATDGMLYLSGCEADFEGFRTGPALRRYDGAWHEEHVEPGSWEESVYASVQAFATALVQDEQPPVDGHAGRAVVELIERVYALTAHDGPGAASARDGSPPSGAAAAPASAAASGSAPVDGSSATATPAPARSPAR
jgi:UDP-N-acetylglucosamine 3-dehydrogenase